MNPERPAPDHQPSPDADTPGVRGAFPSTCWTQLIAHSGDPESARRALETLAHRYWGPVAAYARALRRGQGEPLDDAQSFFAWVAERRLLERLDPSRGRFRGFIKTTLRRFLQDQDRKRRTARRGDGAAAADVHEVSVPDPETEDADAVLDRLWRQELLQQARDSLRVELEQKGRGSVYRIFHDYFLAEEDVDYATVAERHGVTTSDVSNALTTARQRFRAHLRSAVLETVHSDEDLRAELQWLFEDQTG